VHDWIETAEQVRDGAWEVVHLKSGFHRAFKPWLLQWYRVPTKNPFDLNDFQWFSVGRGEDQLGREVQHDCEIWARHSHDASRFIYKISVERDVQPAPDTVCWNVYKSQWWQKPEKLKEIVFGGIVRALSVMDYRTKHFWTLVLTRMFGKLAFDKWVVIAEGENDEDILDSESDDDLVDRRKKRSDYLDRKKIKNALVGLLSRGRPKADVAPCDDVSRGNPVVKRRAGRPPGSKNKKKRAKI
jgi:hypothetical protein